MLLRSISENAISFAQKKGWHKSGNFNFMKAYSNSLLSWASGCKIRRKTTMQGGKQEAFSVKSAIELLSSHHLPMAKFAPHNANTSDVCMHKTGKLNPSHTVGSMIVEIRKDKPVTIWLTGTSNPCLSIYKPFFFGENGVLNEVNQVPDVKFDRKTLWWISERLYRLGNLNYPNLKNIISEDQHRLQQEFIRQEQNFFVNNPNENALQEFSKNSFQASFKVLIDWNNKASKIAWRPTSWNPYYYFLWKRMSGKVGL